MEPLIYFIFKITRLVFSKIATHNYMRTSIGHAKYQSPTSFIGQGNNVS